MFEKDLFYYNKGLKYLAGVDEVGRGCFCGDVVACAIIMPKESRIEGVTDSKKLSEKKRVILNEAIRKEALAIGIGQTPANIIDKVNIKVATHLAMKEAIANLVDQEGNDFEPEMILIDAEKLDDLKYSYEAIIKGDVLSYQIACASIVAKVYRDNLCIKWNEDYAGYGIAKHKGYGTKEHIEALKNLGPSIIHRRSFIKKYI